MGPAAIDLELDRAENTTPENYAWPASFEQQLADLSANGIQVILLFGGNPSWAATCVGRAY